MSRPLGTSLVDGFASEGVLGAITVLAPRLVAAARPSHLRAVHRLDDWVLVVPALENTSFYNHALLFVSEVDILPPEMTESQSITETASRLAGRFLVPPGSCVVITKEVALHGFLSAIDGCPRASGCDVFVNICMMFR